MPSFSRASERQQADCTKIAGPKDHGGLVAERLSGSAAAMAAGERTVAPAEP